MKLKKELGIDKFNSPWEKTILNIIYTNQWIQNHLSELYGSQGLTWQQFQTLKCIERLGPEEATISKIRESMPDKQADTSRMINRLTEKGWVKKAGVEADKRMTNIVLTENGTALLKKLSELSPQLDSIMYNLSKKECKQINLLLDKLRS